MPFWSRPKRPLFTSDWEDEQREISAVRDFDAMLVELWGPEPERPKAVKSAAPRTTTRGAMGTPWRERMRSQP